MQLTTKLKHYRKTHRYIRIGAKQKKKKGKYFSSNTVFMSKLGITTTLVYALPSDIYNYPRHTHTQRNERAYIFVSLDTMGYRQHWKIHSVSFKQLLANSMAAQSSYGKPG